MFGQLGTVLLCFMPIISTDEEFETRYQVIQENLDLISESVNDRNDQINQLRESLMKAQLEKKATREDLANFTSIVAKNVRLEKAVTSLKEVIQESGEKIIELETRYETCAKESEEKEKKIRSLDVEMSKEKMYKDFFHSVVKQLKNFNKSDLDLEIRLSSPDKIK